MSSKYIQFAELNELRSRRSVEVRTLDFETNVPHSTLTEALRFRQEGLSKLKCYIAHKVE